MRRTVITMAIAMATSLFFIAPVAAQGHRTSSNRPSSNVSNSAQSNQGNSGGSKSVSEFKSSSNNVSSQHRASTPSTSSTVSSQQNKGSNAINSTVVRPGADNSAISRSGGVAGSRPSNGGNTNSSSNSSASNGKVGNYNYDAGSAYRPGGSGTASNNSSAGKRPATPTGGKAGRPTNGSTAYSGGYRPSFSGPGSVKHPGYYNPPTRPMLPPRPTTFIYARPPRPVSYRPIATLTFGNILGISIGTSIYSSLDYLLANNYYIDGYDSSTVYLRYVIELGYRWPDATLYYDNGRLVASTYIFSTAYNDLSRYNNIFATMLNRYGNPISVQNGNGYSATWYGANNYITLEYAPAYANNGYMRYYTRLTYGL